MGGPAQSFVVSWDAFHRDVRALACRLAERPPFAAIVAVARGGLVPAAIIARELGIRIVDTVCVSSYSHTIRCEAKLLKVAAPEIMALGQRDKPALLIVDDVVDTGKTAQLVRHLLPRAHFAAVYAKPTGRDLVDTFICEIPQDAWIHFPWDTGLAFQEPLRSDPSPR